MLKNIMARWQTARGDILRKEVEDAILRLGGMGEEINLLCCLTMADAYNLLLEQHGSLSNMSGQGQKLTAKMLSEKAKQRFNSNMGQGHGLFLLSAYFEAHALPGDDALFVREHLQNMLQAALETSKNIDTNRS